MLETPNDRRIRHHQQKYKTLRRITYDKVTELTKQHKCVQAVYGQRKIHIIKNNDANNVTKHTNCTYLSLSLSLRFKKVRT